MSTALPPDYTAFICELVEGLEIDAILYRGKRLDLPVLESADDRPFDLAEKAEDASLLLAFYPGGWCPRSRALLMDLEARRADFERAAGRIVAVTVERPTEALRTLARTGIRFPIAIDHAARFTRSLGLGRKMPTVLRRQLRDAGIRLKEWNGEGSFDLPLPALVTIDADRRIGWVETAASPATLDLAAALGVAERMGRRQ